MGSDNFQDVIERGTISLAGHSGLFELGENTDDQPFSECLHGAARGLRPALNYSRNVTRPKIDEILLDHLLCWLTNWSSAVSVNMSQFIMQVKLEKAIRHKNRFFLTPDLVEHLNFIIDTASKHFTTEIVADNFMFRARRHSVAASELQVPYMHEYTPEPHPAEVMGAPPSHIANAGRLNAAGIPYLYAASDKLTAVSEVRPWVGAYLSVAQLRLTQTVKLIDARLCEKPPTDPANDATDFERFWNLWQRTICWSFSLPHHPEDNTAYTPTQYLTAAIHHAGFDGVMYSSSLNRGGFNIALFNPSTTRVESVELERVASVRYELA